MAYYENEQLRQLPEPVGKTMRSVTQDGKDSIEFESTDGDRWRMYHHASCCERVEIEDVVGDLQDLVGYSR